jgi:hypothetical protein
MSAGRCPYRRVAKNLEVKIAGLWTSPNDYTAPAGAQDVADNTIIDQQNLQESRRGFEVHINNAEEGLDGFPLQTLTSTLLNTTEFDLLTYRINEESADGRLLLNDRDTITGDNRFLPPTGARRPRMVNWGQYIYVTGDDGVKRYSVPDNSSEQSGIPQALDLTLSLTGSSGYLTSNESASVTATVTNASPLLSIISNDEIGEFVVGQIITGTGIPVGTTVQSISTSTPVVILAATLSAGSTTVSVASSTGIVADQIVTGTGIPDNTRVVSVSGGGPFSVVLTNASIITGTENLTFGTDNTVTMSANATSGAPSIRTLTLSEGTQVAYRLLWGIRNDNDAVSLGAPSSFTTIINNTGETRDVQAVATIPEGITTDYFYQLYRSVATPTQSIVPADQMQLVVEGFPDNTDISNGFVTITDQTPDSLKGESLYTGSDIEGIGQSNYRPPTAVDIATFRGYMLYANYTLPHQLQLTIDGVGAPSGVQPGDVVTIGTLEDSFDLTASLTEDIPTGTFEVITGGTPAQNIADTAASFIRVLNRYSDNDLVYAFNTSGPNDLPGQMLLEARSGITGFSVEASSHGDAWTPNIDTTQSSAADAKKNGLLISKVQQPEAVPRLNLRLAGGIGNEITRIVPLREYVVVVTTEGIYRLTGQTLNDFTVEPFDLTVQVVAPETAQALGNECWALATVGAVSISDGGVRIRSGLQINDVLQSLIRQAPTSVKDYAFGVAYESDQRYILSLPDSEGDTVCTQQYCYNYITEKWTRWTRNCTAGYVNKQTGLYLGNGNNTNVVLERKNGTFTDYVDESFEITIVSFSGVEVTLSSLEGITTGDLLWQLQDGVAYFAEIIAIDYAGTSVTVDKEITWELSGEPEDTRIQTAIDCVIQWKPMSAGDPTEAKQCSEGQYIFRIAKFASATAGFATDVSPAFESVELLGQSGSGWGLFPWGEAPWGGVLRPKTLRYYIPANKQYCGVLIPRLQIRSGYSNWKLEGGSVVLNDVSFELGSSDG